MITYIGPKQREASKKAIKSKLSSIKNMYLIFFMLVPMIFLAFHYEIITPYEKITGDRMATCRIEVDGQGICTAFLISENGLLLTARHCVEDGGEVILNFTKIKEPGYSNIAAKVIHYPKNPNDDYAILKTQSNLSIKPFKLAARVKDPDLYNPYVTGIGYPQGKDQAYDNNNNVRIYNIESDSTVFEIQEIYKGMSGGPVIDNETKEVIGIISWKVGDSQFMDIEAAEKYGVIITQGRDTEGLSYAEKIFQIYEDPEASHIDW